MQESAPAVVPPVPRTNRILAGLPPEEIAVLQPRLESVTLPFRQDLYEADSPVDYVYFLHRGVASMLTRMSDGSAVEIATVGPEGMVGMPIFLGAERMPSTAFMQVPGNGVRMEADAFRKAIGRCPALNHLLLRYTLALMNQMAQNAACNRTHAVEERCSRWLLMTQDRVRQPTFPLTQEFLAQMLGVRRPTVSVAANMLARAGLVSYVRGQMTILDRPGLEAASCECYRIIAGEFERLVGDSG
ncbi:MAG TPA: Crp/Fnr family transcriptional regulator [Roseomonas sp.]|jgi:CRP-like cAMP-binding protein